MNTELINSLLDEASDLKAEQLDDYLLATILTLHDLVQAPFDKEKAEGFVKRASAVWDKKSKHERIGALAAYMVEQTQVASATLQEQRVNVRCATNYFAGIEADGARQYSVTVFHSVATRLHGVRAKSDKEAMEVAYNLLGHDMTLTTTSRLISVEANDAILSSVKVGDGIFGFDVTQRGDETTRRYDPDYHFKGNASSEGMEEPA